MFSSYVVAFLGVLGNILYGMEVFEKRESYAVIGDNTERFFYSPCLIRQETDRVYTPSQIQE